MSEIPKGMAPKAELPKGDLPAQLTARQRLAKSREALTNSLNGGQSEDNRDELDDLGAEWGQAAVKEHVKPGGKPRKGWWPVFSALTRTWWHRHPLNAVGHMARPVIETYARHDPMKLLAVAAVVGAVAVVVRPWRLLSAGALLAAVLRPSEISAFAMTMLSSFNATMQMDKKQRAAEEAAARMRGD